MQICGISGKQGARSPFRDKWAHVYRGQCRPYIDQHVMPNRLLSYPVARKICSEWLILLTEFIRGRYNVIGDVRVQIGIHNPQRVQLSNMVPTDLKKQVRGEMEQNIR